MRKLLISICAGVLLLVGCSNAHSALPQPGYFTQPNQIDAGILPSSLPKNYTVFHYFGGITDGAGPAGTLVRDNVGNIYGTTQYGITGDGVVFKLDPSGNETILHSFSGPDGNRPEAGLVRDSAGNLYGTTMFGGQFDNGVVFKLDSSGNFSVLHKFNGTDGSTPKAGLILDGAGNLYGTTYYGGSSGLGEVFKVTQTGKLTELLGFNGVTDGAFSAADLVRDAAGNLYGTTELGGSSDLGTVFKLDSSGNETVLHSFSGTARSGRYPVAGLVRDAAGNLYGTTERGGKGRVGVVFKISPRGDETVLHGFDRSDGANPVADLALDAAGNLYGTTQIGGFSNGGVAFRIDPHGNEIVLHNFHYKKGAEPQAGLILDTAGNLWGTTLGASHSGGVVFELSHR